MRYEIQHSSPNGWVTVIQTDLKDSAERNLQIIERKNPDVDWRLIDTTTV